MASESVNLASVVELFGGIGAVFPGIRMELTKSEWPTQLSMSIPAQPGLAFAINLNLQGDELHLHAGAFWLEWFPCTKPDIVAAYREAVVGLLSGEYRIVEYCARGRAYRAELQRPDREEWRVIGTWFDGISLAWWRNTTRVLQNREGAT